MRGRAPHGIFSWWITPACWSYNARRRMSPSRVTSFDSRTLTPAVNKTASGRLPRAHNKAFAGAERKNALGGSAALRSQVAPLGSSGSLARMKPSMLVLHLFILAGKRRHTSSACSLRRALFWPDWCLKAGSKVWIVRLVSLTLLPEETIGQASRKLQCVRRLVGAHSLTHEIPRN